MSNLLTSFVAPKPVSKRLTLLAGVMTVVSFVGFLDATYLSAKRIQGLVPSCTLLKGCEVVTTSSYSTLASIPVAFLGVAYYGVLFLVLLAYIDRRTPLLLIIAARLTIVGLIASAYFIFVQIFLIKALCLYCLMSAVSSTVLFVLGMIVLWTASKKNISYRTTAKTASLYMAALVYLIMTVIVATALFFWSFTTIQNRRPVLLRLGTGTVAVEIAATVPSRTQGVAARPSLAADRGMLFAFPTDNFYAFWMKGMHFPLDIIWLSGEGLVVGLSSNLQPASYPATVLPPEPVRYVLEVNAGWAEQHNVQVGLRAAVARP